MLNPTVLTAGQEREQRGGFVLGSSWNGKGTHMWRLKQEKPELFERQEQLQVVKPVESKPPGFEACHMEGWLYHKERSIYLEKSTGRRFWFDEVGRLHRPLREGEARPVALTCGAKAMPGLSVSSAAGSDADTKQQPAPKHIMISDLHAAAKALRLDLRHLDGPAGALALAGGRGAEATARSLPGELLRRLAAFRGEWSDEMLGGAIASAFADVAAGLGGASPTAAVALVAGQRVVAAASPGTRFVISAHASSGSSAPAVSASAAPRAGEPTATRCRKLADGSTDSLLVALAVGELGDAGAGGLDLAAAVAPHLAHGRARAASIALLRSARERHGAEGPLAAACARLGPRSDGPQGSGEAASSSQPPAKRPRQEEPLAGGKLRLRQVLLRHRAAQRPHDPVRGRPRCARPARRRSGGGGGAVPEDETFEVEPRPVKRTLEEAEEQMMGVLDGLVADGCAGFAAVCKSISECQSALKGGEFAGDLGWIDRRTAEAPKQPEREKALRVQLPANVLKAAFELAVGELSDVLSSDLGVHLLQRTA